MASVFEAVLREREGAVVETDTIYALSSGAPPAGIAVVRASGPGVRRVLAAIAGRVPEPRVATVRELRHPATGDPIDTGLVLYFAAPASFTGEDVAEFHVHGGRAVVSALFGALSDCGLRLAEPGEFTRRAFLSGRLDLTEAEGIADLIAAETDAQRRQALGQAQGSIRTQYESWRARIVRARGLIEAELDFSDEEGVAGAWAAEGRREVTALAAELRAALGDLGRGRLIREGAEIVILGAVNAGKSSLLNAIARKEAAIVSDEPGTTRDLIEVPVDLRGYRAVLVDTAGLRDGEGSVEREGIRRARHRAAEADLVLWLRDDAGSRPPAGGSAPVWIVATKSDLLDSRGLAAARAECDHLVSAKTGAGVPELLAALADHLERRVGGREAPVVTRARHAEALGVAVAAIDAAIASREAEVAAEELRRASDAIGRITGRVDVEEILDVVFREFCIGK